MWKYCHVLAFSLYKTIANFERIKQIIDHNSINKRQGFTSVQNKSMNNKSQLYHTDINVQVLIAFNDSIFTLSPELSRFKSTKNKSQLYHTDIHVAIINCI